jgi:hypothetical protein
MLLIDSCLLSRYTFQSLLFRAGIVQGLQSKLKGQEHADMQRHAASQTTRADITFIVAMRETHQFGWSTYPPEDRSPAWRQY